MWILWGGCKDELEHVRDLLGEMSMKEKRERAGRAFRPQCRSDTHEKGEAKNWVGKANRAPRSPVGGSSCEAASASTAPHTVLSHCPGAPGESVALTATGWGATGH